MIRLSMTRLGDVRAELVSGLLTETLETLGHAKPGPRDGCWMTTWLLGHQGSALPDAHPVWIARDENGKLFGWACRTAEHTVAHVTGVGSTGRIAALLTAAARHSGSVGSMITVVG